MLKLVTKLGFIPLLGLVLSACSLPQLDFAAGDRVSLDYSPPGYSIVLAPMTSVAVSTAQTYQDGESIVVSGRVKRMHEIQLPGHVDLAICTPDGTLVAQETKRIPNLASKRGGVQEWPFRFQLPLTPPEGAIIRLQYHAPASGNGELGCEKS